MQQYLGNKLHLPSGGLTFETIHAALKEKNVGQSIIDEVKALMDECDAIRYASADISLERMKGSHQRLLQSIDSLERNLK